MLLISVNQAARSALWIIYHCLWCLEAAQKALIFNNRSCTRATNPRCFTFFLWIKKNCIYRCTACPTRAERRDIGAGLQWTPCISCRYCAKAVGGLLRRSSDMGTRKEKRKPKALLECCVRARSLANPVLGRHNSRAERSPSVKESSSELGERWKIQNDSRYDRNKVESSSQPLCSPSYLLELRNDGTSDSSKAKTSR